MLKRYYFLYKKTTNKNSLYQLAPLVLTYIHVRVEELGPGIAGQHVDDDDLPPLLHVDQEVAQLPVVLVDQVDALGTNLLKSHDNASCHQLQQINHNIKTQVTKTLLTPSTTTKCTVSELVLFWCVFTCKLKQLMQKSEKAEERDAG